MGGSSSSAPVVKNDEALMSRITGLETLLSSERNNREQSDRAWREESMRNTERVTGLMTQLQDATKTRASLDAAQETIARQTADIANMSQAQAPITDPVVSEVDSATAAAASTVQTRLNENKSRKSRGSLLIPMGGSAGTGLSIPTG